MRGLPEGYPLNDQWEVTPAGLAGVMGGERGGDVPDEAHKPLLLDVRNPDEVAGSRIHDDATVIRLQELQERVEELAPHKDRRIIVHCRLGQRSLRAAQFLRDRGYDAWSMAGGIEAYERAYGGTSRR
ncbi:hypothetical protein PSMK_18450 [Phycisphaera mikurensis NBRC 102666]|uniref:Rhodanese domain-containing protein n=2 Tax=Phycisphaera TaxID=666508 RepID=I0IFG6_PHYMF|nr:hypothetical protein PSMK_18450 [Phycisphaera mikurensis NBRC 102666]